METIKQLICKIIFEKYGSGEAVETAAEMYDLIEVGVCKAAVLTKIRAHRNCSDSETGFPFEEIYDRIICEIQELKNLYAGILQKKCRNQIHNK